MVLQNSVYLLVEEGGFFGSIGRRFAGELCLLPASVGGRVGWWGCDFR